MYAQQCECVSVCIDKILLSIVCECECVNVCVTSECVMCVTSECVCVCSQWLCECVTSECVSVSV